MDDSMLWRVLVATEDFYMTEFLTQDYIMELENDTGIPLNNCVDIFKGDEFKIFKPYPISFVENHKITIYYLALKNDDPNMMYLIKENYIGERFSFKEDIDKKIEGDDEKMSKVKIVKSIRCGKVTVSEGDIICVETNDNTKFEGRLVFIKEDYILLDNSRKYNASEQNISLSHIKSISFVEIKETNKETNPDDTGSMFNDVNDLTGIADNYSRKVKNSMVKCRH